MMFMDKMAEGIFRLSVMDREIDLFESQYPVPNGVSYNSCACWIRSMPGSRMNGLTDLMKSSREGSLTIW